MSVFIRLLEEAGQEIVPPLVAVQGECLVIVDLICNCFIGIFYFIRLYGGYSFGMSFVWNSEFGGYIIIRFFVKADYRHRFFGIDSRMVVVNEWYCPSESIRGWLY